MCDTIDEGLAAGAAEEVWEKSMKNLVKSLLCFAVYFAFQFIVQVFFMMAGAAAGISDQDGMIDFSMNHLLLITLTANVITVVCFVLYNRIRRKSVKAEWSMLQVKAKSYLYSVAAALLFSFAWALVTYDMSFANAEQIAQSVTFYSGILPGMGSVLMALTLLLAQPVTEEILCRGIMLNLLRKSFPEWAAVLVSAAVFGLAHLMAGGVVLALGAALMGIYFGIVFVKTKSLYAAVAAHAFANLPDFVMPLLPELQFGARIVLAAALAAISIVLLHMCGMGTAVAAEQ